MAAKLVALVLPLGLDTFAVAATLGMMGATAGRRRKITLLFTGFEAGMPLIGLGLGAPLGHALGGAADFVAVGVLIAFGLYTLLAERDTPFAELAEMRGIGGVILGLSISLDELAIGFTLGLLRLPVILVIVLIAVQTAFVTQIGLRLGGRISARLRESAEHLAGAVLTCLGLVLLAQKLLS